MWFELNKNENQHAHFQVADLLDGDVAAYCVHKLACELVTISLGDRRLSDSLSSYAAKTAGI